MKVITAEKPFFNIVPRFFSNDFFLTLDNGVPITYDVEKLCNKMQVTILDTSIFTQGETYSFTVKNSSEIIYKGKIIFLKNGTDVQNYSAQKQDLRPWT